MGFYFPKNIRHTKFITEEIGLPDKVYEQIGISQIYVPDNEDHPRFMAKKSAIKALQDAKVAPEQVDLIVVPVFKNEFMGWQMSIWLKENLGAKNALTMECRGGCAAFFEAIEFAADQINSSSNIETVLVSSSERLYGYGWPSFLSTGSQSIVLKKNCQNLTYLGFETNNYIAHHDIAYIPNGGIESPFNKNTPWENGAFDNVVSNTNAYYEHIKPHFFTKFIETFDRLLKKTGYSKNDIDFMVTITQQRNFDTRILKAIGLDCLPNANEFKSKLGHFGGADTYILLNEAIKNKKVKKGDLILEFVIGGIGWYASLIRY
ncbi:3-oxoacyl-[acyl-carrier-protein] synthase 3 [Streptococcus mutans]|nr:3-oxoacyl-[acyl-carrier-protein] synthase 3 [Streptococcus mutans]